MKQDHTPEWICALCRNTTLKTMQQTSEHIESLHEKEMNDFGLSLVVSWCAVRTYGITSCPLCASKGPQDAPELVDHVLTHVYDFSLRSLPWTQNISEDPKKPIGTYNLPEDQHDADSLMEWLQDLSTIVAEDAMMNHHNVIHGISDNSTSAKQLCTDEVEYFAHHDYFDQGSIDACSRENGTRSSDSASLRLWTNKTNIQEEASHSLPLSDFGYGTDEYSTETDSFMEEEGSGKDDAEKNDVSEEDLAKSLAGKVEKSEFDHSKEFFPHGSIDGIITRDRVRRKLKPRRGHSSTETQESRQEEVDRLADSILRGSKKTFAIMLYASFSNKDLREAMTQFRTLGFDDGNLPLVGEATTRIFFSSTTKRHRRPWNHFRVDAFCSNQWKFLAPVFDRKQSEWALHTDHILPFTSAIQRGAGMFSEVHEVTIHPAHGKNVAHVRDSSRCQGSCSQSLLTCASIIVRIPTLQSKDCNAPTPRTGTRGRSSKVNGAR